MLAATPKTGLGSTATTEGVRVDVDPRFLPEQSDVPARQYYFAYRIRIHNESDAPVRLISRHWIIVDAFGRRQEVKGDGVVGQQPRLLPGEVHEYSSFCPLQAEWGTMEGTYQMRRDDGTTFDAVVARFYFVAPTDRD